jgi:hypothetical protein
MAVGRRLSQGLGIIENASKQSVAVVACEDDPKWCLA